MISKDKVQNTIDNWVDNPKREPSKAMVIVIDSDGAVINQVDDDGKPLTREQAIGMMKSITLAKYGSNAWKKRTKY